MEAVHIGREGLGGLHFVFPSFASFLSHGESFLKKCTAFDSLMSEYGGFCSVQSSGNTCDET